MCSIAPRASKACGVVGVSKAANAYSPSSSGPDRKSGAVVGAAEFTFGRFSCGNVTIGSCLRGCDEAGIPMEKSKEGTGMGAVAVVVIVVVEGYVFRGRQGISSSKSTMVVSGEVEAMGIIQGGGLIGVSGRGGVGIGSHGRSQSRRGEKSEAVIVSITRKVEGGYGCVLEKREVGKGIRGVREE